MVGNALSDVSASPALQAELRTDCRVMQGLAQACELFADNLRGQPETEELLYAVAAQWERMHERLLRMSGEEP